MWCSARACWPSTGWRSAPHINNINFNQGIFERVIGTGNLEIESAGKDGQTVFDNIRHPDGVQQEIYKMMEDDDAEAQRRGPPVVPRRR